MTKQTEFTKWLKYIKEERVRTTQKLSEPSFKYKPNKWLYPKTS